MRLSLVNVSLPVYPQSIIINSMAKSRGSYSDIHHSFKEHWAQVDPFLLELFTKRFPNQTKITLNYAASHNDSQVLLSQSLIRKSRERVNNFKSQEQVDLRMGLALSSWLWMKFSTEEVKMHYQSGYGVTLPLLGTWQPYLSFSSTRKFKNSSFKFGILSHSQSSFADLRLRYNVGQHRADTFYYVKAGYSGEKFRASGIATAIRKVHQVYLQKNDLMGAIRIGGKNWVGMVLNTDGFRNYKINYTRMGSYFDTLKAVYLLYLSDLKLGLLYEYSIEDSTSKKLQAAVDYRNPIRHWSSKFRINTLWQIGMGMQWQGQNWHLQGGVSWFNSKTAWPSHYTIAIAYY